MQAYINNTIGKSAIFKVEIVESIQTDGSHPSIVRPDWIDDIIDKVVIDSIEQTATSTEDGGINILTVTLTNGATSTFEVRNGTKGNQGEKGEKGSDGYTPKREIDYWTEADKAEIKTYVNSVFETSVIDSWEVLV